jgi:WD40 repeat protein
VWDCFHDKPCFPPLDHPVDVEDVAFSPDGSLLATCCADKTYNKFFAQVWNASTGKPVGPRLLHDDGVLCVSFSPDGKRLVTGDEKFTAMVWDVQTGKSLTPALRHEAQVKSAVFSPNGKWIVTVTANMVRIWDSVSGDPVVPNLQNLARLSKAAFLPDGATVAVSDINNTAWRWRLPVDLRPESDLWSVARLLSGTSGPLASGPAPKQEPPELIWQQLASKYPFDFTVSSEQVAGWHEFQAAECEQNEKWFAAVFHLNQLILLRPGDQSLRQRLAQALEHLKAGDSEPTDR